MPEKGFIPAVLNQSVIDEVIAVSDQEAFAHARLLARTTGILAGVSSGRRSRYRACDCQSIRVGRPDDRRSPRRNRGALHLLPAVHAVGLTTVRERGRGSAEWQNLFAEQTVAQRVRIPTAEIG
jgi:hypothetical protein